uniref:U3 small nucleolar RNA-associated protein 18 homolog n=2 Tax=Cacopsylla melanoneura TaxID=428564 RepID=A0A8D8VKE6_9HEMI
MNSRAFKKNRSVKTIDKNERYGDYLKKKFISQFPRPTWADHTVEVKKSEDGDEEGDDLTKQAGGFVQKSKNKSLATNYLSFNKLNDVNKETRGAEGRVVTAMEFHPSIQVALVGGQAGVLSLFQVTGGADNPKLAQVQAEAFPIRVAHFSSDTEILAGSNKSPDLFVYNMETGEASKTRVRYQDNIKNFRMSPDLNSIAICGDNGSIRLYSSRTKEFCTQFKMNCYVNDVCFAPNGTTLYSTGGTGEIYQWDVRSSVPVQTFTDDGCIKGSRLGISPDGKLLAAGSTSGVVNIYDLPITSSKPVPNKTLFHLTTGITELKFNHSSEILAFSSLDKNGAIKLYNVKSKNVFLNFPDQRMAEKLCRPNVVDFSPNSGFFAFTNNDRSSFLFRLNHYAKY